MLGLDLTADGATEIARRAAARRASPAGCCGECATSPPSTATAMDRDIADGALGELEVDRRPGRHGPPLSAHDRKNYGGGPVGVETIAAALSEPRDAIEDIVEPFLIQKGFVQRTPRGRLLTSHAFKHLGNGSTDPTFGVDLGRNPPIAAYIGFSVNIRCVSSIKTRARRSARKSTFPMRSGKGTPRRRKYSAMSIRLTTRCSTRRICCGLIEAQTVIWLQPREFATPCRLPTSGARRRSSITWMLKETTAQPK